MKKLIVLCVVCVMLYVQGCSTIAGVGDLMAGIGDDVSGLANGAKTQIQNSK